MELESDNEISKPLEPEQNRKAEDVPDMELHSGEGKPIRVSLGVYVLIQLAVGCATFGMMYASIRRDILEQGKAIEEVQKKKDDFYLFQREALQRLVRMETKIENLADQVGYYRPRIQAPKPAIEEEK